MALRTIVSKSLVKKFAQETCFNQLRCMSVRGKLEFFVKSDFT